MSAPGRHTAGMIIGGTAAGSAHDGLYYPVWIIVQICFLLIFNPD